MEDLSPRPAPPAAPTVWRALFGRRYIAGRRFTLSHAVAHRAIDLAAEVLWRRPRRPLPPDDTLRQIVVAKPDHIGDLLMATPFLAALKAGRPDVPVLLLVGRWNRGCAELLQQCGLCDEVEYLDLPFLSGKPDAARLRLFLADVRRLRARLRRGGPAAFVDLRPYAPNTLFLAALAGKAVGWRIGFGTRGFSRLLDGEIPYERAVPMGQQILGALPLLGLPEPGPYRGPVLPGFPEAFDLARFGLAPGGYILLHMESREQAREVPSAVWRDLLESVLRAGTGGRTFVLVGKAEGENGRQALAFLAERGVPALSLAGKTGFADLFHLARGAAGTVCIDSLGSHLSLTFRRPTLVLMRAGISEYGSFPAPGPDLPLFFTPTGPGQEAERALDARRFALSLAA